VKLLQSCSIAAVSFIYIRHNGTNIVIKWIPSKATTICLFRHALLYICIVRPDCHEDISLSRPFLSGVALWLPAYVPVTHDPSRLRLMGPDRLDERRRCHIC